jgi:hypothetical protein
MKSLIIIALAALIPCFAHAKETVLSRHIEELDLSRAYVSCSASGDKYYLQVSVGDIYLWINHGPAQSERECYSLKFTLENAFKKGSRQQAEVIEVEVYADECDQRRMCPVPWPDYQTRVSLTVAGQELAGYRKRRPLSPSEPVRHDPQDGCVYYGKLGGGWECR